MDRPSSRICSSCGSSGATYKDHYRTNSIWRSLCLLIKIMIRSLRHYLSITNGLLLLLVILALMNLSNLRSIQTTFHEQGFCHGRSLANRVVTDSDRHPTKQVWMRANNMETGYLKHVTGVLQSLGYTTNGGTYSDWTLLWSHQYPFTEKNLKPVLSSLKPHQRVNKFPGSGFVTSKVNLATSDYKYIPKAFKLPSEKSDLEAYAKAHPDTKWVQKSNKHRGINIKAVSDLDLSAMNTFVQRYVDNPLLIDKKKFDFGVYTIITSIDPLRIYIVNHELLLRFCAADYEPFDPAVRDKYVVTDDYTPVWEIPTLAKYYKNGFTAKESFRQFMRDMGEDADILYEQMEQVIRDMYTQKKSQIMEILRNYKQRNFFEMVRFDFVVDDKYHLYLMEVNMSPNLSSNHFESNKILYEQVLMNLFHLVGLADSLPSWTHLAENEQDMLVGPRDLSIRPHECATTCADGCKALECRLCYPCLTTSEKDKLRSAYQEHMNRRNCKRVMPPPMKQETALTWRPENWDLLTPEDQWMHTWFAGKCYSDVSWC